MFGCYCTEMLTCSAAFCRGIFFPMEQTTSLPVQCSLDLIFGVKCYFILFFLSVTDVSNFKEEYSISDSVRILSHVFCICFHSSPLRPKIISKCTQSPKSMHLIIGWKSSVLVIHRMYWSQNKWLNVLLYARLVKSCSTYVKMLNNALDFK